MFPADKQCLACKIDTHASWRTESGTSKNRTHQVFLKLFVSFVTCWNPQYQVTGGGCHPLLAFTEEELNLEWVLKAGEGN